MVCVNPRRCGVITSKSEAESVARSGEATGAQMGIAVASLMTG
jgi:hypothetical protein